MHAIPVRESANFIDINSILNQGKKVLGDNMKILLDNSYKTGFHNLVDIIKNKPYYTIRIMNFVSGEIDSTQDWSFIVNDEISKILPSQLWRKLLYPILSPDIHIDLTDYVKLINITIKDIIDGEIISKLRKIHDRFWNI